MVTELGGNRQTNNNDEACTLVLLPAGPKSAELRCDEASVGSWAPLPEPAPTESVQPRGSFADGVSADRASRMREMKVVMVQQGNGVLGSCGRENSSGETDPNLLSERETKPNLSSAERDVWVERDV
jgi:hypothetical protein